jgi:hypothetical protein
MSATSFFKSLAGEALDFFDFVGQALGNDRTRRDLVRDLGGDPAANAPVTPFAQDRLDSIRAYRDNADSSAEAALGVLQDIGVLIGAIAANYAAWRTSWRHGAQDTAHALFELLATNYARLRFPRTFLILQAFSFAEEVTTLDAPGSNSGVYGSNSGVHLWQAIKAAGLFLWHPGRIFEELDPEGTGSRGFDFAVRMLAVGLVLLDVGVGTKKVQLLKDISDAVDVLYGWDGPGVDVDSPQRPRGADLISERMATLVMQNTTGDPSAEVQGIENLKLTLTAVPRAHGGAGIFVSVGGKFERLVPLSDNWQLSAKLEGDSTISALLSLSPRFLRPDGHSALRIGLISRAAPDGGPSFALPHRTGSRIEIGRISFGTTFASNKVELALRISDGALVLDAEDNDGFIGSILAGIPLRLPFSIGLGVSTERGLFFEGAVPPFFSRPGPAQALAARAAAPSDPALPELPPLASPGTLGGPSIEGVLPLALSLGPVTINHITLRLTRAPTDKPLRDTTRFAVEALTSFSVRLGPVFARVEKLGISLAIDGGKPPEQSNLGVVDLDLGLSGPEGIAVAVDAKGVVTGGGFLYHDRAQGLYAGVMELTVRDRITVKAFGLVGTRLPDGSKGYSLIVFITVEGFRPIPLGMQCTLQGFGGMIAINRTFNEEAMREGLRNNTLATLLFPRDPVHNAPEIIRNLNIVFPAASGSYMLGFLAKIGWFSPTLVLLELGLILEWGNRLRLIVLGRLSAMLPSRENDLVRINMDALGVIDFTEGTAAIDAVLVDSRLAHKFPLTGAMALRARWTTGPGAGFALAIGGFNPHFAPPAGMPKLDRVAIALSSGDNPRLTCEAYFAITSNTIQFGAHAELYAAAFGFNVQGDVGFDVLIQLAPFHFLAEFHASLQLKRGSRSLFKVSLAGALEGPRPLRVSGKASFEIFWCDFSIRFDKTLVSGEKPPLPPAVNVLDELKRALANRDNWSTQLALNRQHGVSLRKLAPGTNVVLDPLGNLLVKQQVVPLNTARDIDTFGGAPVAGARRFAVRATLNGAPQQGGFVKEGFAPAQLFSMSDDEKIASPSFEDMDAGLMFGSDAVVFTPAQAVPAPLEYETIVLDEPAPENAPSPQRYPLTQERLLQHARFGAVAKAPIRNLGQGRFRNADAPQVAMLRTPNWVIASVDDGKTIAPQSQAGATYSAKLATMQQLNQQSGGARRWQLVPEHEVPA